MYNSIPLSPLATGGENPNGFALQSSPTFNSLPLMVQESILQSNATVQSEDELKKLITYLIQ